MPSQTNNNPRMHGSRGVLLAWAYVVDCSMTSGTGRAVNLFANLDTDVIYSIPFRTFFNELTTRF